MAEAAAFREHFFSADDGLRLHAREYGRHRPGTLPVICLAGLTRNCRDFDAIARLLAADAGTPRHVFALDYRGRGKSGHDRDWRNYNPVTEARDVATALTVFGIEQAAFIGTSRGGIVTMMLAGSRPGAIAAAIFNDTGPVIEGEGLARIRSQLRKMTRPRDMEEAIELQKQALGHQFPALDHAAWQRHTSAIYRKEKGALVPDHDPKLLKTLEAIDFSRPLSTFWPQFRGLDRIPLMILRGEASDVLSADSVAEMQAGRAARTEIVTVAGQGHPPLLETGDLPQRITAFLARADRDG
ncbi:MAG: alpha/beta fold hydrolase [Rhizobiaceae bacterium]